MGAVVSERNPYYDETVALLDSIKKRAVNPDEGRELRARRRSEKRRKKKAWGRWR